MRRILLVVLGLTLAAGAAGQPIGLPFPAPTPMGGKVDHDWRNWFRAHQHDWYRLPQLLGERYHAEGQADGEKDKPTGNSKPDEKWRAGLAARLEPILVQLVDKGGALERRVAMVGLGRLKRTAQLSRLTELAEKKHLPAAHALVLMEHAQLYDTLVAWASAQSRDIRLRTLALLGIGSGGSPQAAAWLVRFFDHKDKDIRARMPKTRGKKRDFRIAALAALALAWRDQGQHRKFVKLCGTVWHDKKFHEDVRAYAVSWIGKRGGEEHVEPMLKALRRERREQIRRSAALAVGLIAPAGDPKTAKAVASAFSKERNKPIRHFLALSLGRIGGEEGVQRLKRLMDGAKKVDRGFLYLALGYTRHRDAIPLLTRSVQRDPDEFDVAAAAMGLFLHGPDSGTKELRDRLKTANSTLLWTNLTMSLAVRRDKETLKLLERIKKTTALTSKLPALALFRPRETLAEMDRRMANPKTEWERLSLPRIVACCGSRAAAGALERHWAGSTGKKRQESRMQSLLALIDLAAGPELVPLPELRRDMNYFIRLDALDRLFGDPLRHDSK